MTPRRRIGEWRYSSGAINCTILRRVITSASVGI